VLECGAPVSLLDVARELWRRYSPPGMEFSVRYIGIRPGERIDEVLLADGETLESSGAEGIGRVIGPAAGVVDINWLTAEFAEWERLLLAGERDELRERLMALPTVAPKLAPERG
jgi:FlaA1/EpsC-like NDP-sugar epimerase